LDELALVQRRRIYPRPSGPRARGGRKRFNLRERRKKLFTRLQHLEEAETRYRTRVAYRVTAATEQTSILQYLREHPKIADKPSWSRRGASQNRGIASRPPQAGRVFCNRDNPAGSECVAHGITLCARAYPTVSSHTRRQVGTRLAPGRTRFFRDARALPDGLPKTGGSPGRRRPRRVPPRGR
jgi:hypothetical protein